MFKISQNPEYKQKLNQLVTSSKASSPEYVTALKELMYTFGPELKQIEQEMATFEQAQKLSTQENNEPIKPLTAQQQAQMKQEFVAVHKKNAEIYKASAQLMDNPDYQHQAQLIAEKYCSDKNSTEYLNAMDALNDTFLPGFRKAKEEIKAISERYQNK